MVKIAASSIVSAASTGRPFAKHAVRSLRLVAATLVVAGLAVPALRGIADAAVLERNPDDASTWGRVGRNEPCPCGSGKKYKHCHGTLTA